MMMTISVRTIQSPLRFQGLTIIHQPHRSFQMHLRGTDYYDVCDGTKKPHPFGLDGIDLNSGPIARSAKIGDLCKRLLAGETVDEETIRTTLKEVLKPSKTNTELDFSLQKDPQFADLSTDFQQTMLDSFKALQGRLSAFAAKANILFHGPESDLRKVNDDFVELYRKKPLKLSKLPSNLS
jgi:hypothetical protein